MFRDRRIFVLLLAIAALAADKKAEHLDFYGDPLPQGAIARMGTVRGRLPGLVTACAFSRDGKILVAAGGDAAIHLFYAATGRPLRQWHRHKKYVTCLSFSPNGKMLASGSEDGTLCLWEWPSGKVLRQFAAHKKGVRVLAFAGTGKFLASGGEDNLVRLWDPATGRELRHLSGHKAIVTAVAVSPDGRFVASGSQSLLDPARLWDAENGRLLWAFNGADVDWVQSLAISPDSKLIAHQAGVFKVALRDIASGKIVRQLSSERGGCSLSTVAFSPDGRSVAAASAFHHLVLWDTVTGKILHQLPASRYVRYPGGITCLAFSPDGRRLAFGEDHCLRVWNLGAWREVHPVEGHANCIFRVLFSRDNKTLITAADEVTDALQEWDAATGKKLRTMWHQYLMGRHGFHLSPDHRVLTIAEREEKSLLLLYSRNTATGKEIRRVKLPFNSQWNFNSATIVLSPDGKIITSESRNDGDRLESVLLRDTTAGKVLGKLSGNYDRLVFSPDSAVLACIGRKQIDLYNVSRDRIIGKLPLPGKRYDARSLAFSRNGRLLAVASSLSDDSSRNRIDLWEATTGQKRAALLTPRLSLADLALSPDGSFLAGGDSDGVLHFWSVASGKEFRQLQGHRGGIESLAFSHNGKLLASGSWDTTALIWDMREAGEATRPHFADVPRDRLERLWTDLAGNDGNRPHRAIWDLVAARQVMPWLREHLKPVPKADAPRIARLIADLDSDSFAVREKATHELEAMAEAAEPALRKVLAGKPSLELRRRVEPIVKTLENWPATSSASLRDWRALEVLEHLGTAEARRLLQQLADGVSEARLTRAAKAVLQRLAARGDTMP